MKLNLSQWLDYSLSVLSYTRLNSRGSDNTLDFLHAPQTFLKSDTN
jgi:hypothetical protein